VPAESIDYKLAITRFAEACRWTWCLSKQYRILFHGAEKRHELLNRSATHFFQDVMFTFQEAYVLQLCKLSEAGRTFGHRNLSARLFLDDPGLPLALRSRLEVLCSRLDTFRSILEPARNKIIGHADLPTALANQELGAFSEDDEASFWKDLQEVVHAVYEHHYGEKAFITNVVMQGDADDLVEALKKAVIYDKLADEQPMESLDWLDKSDYRDA